MLMDNILHATYWPFIVLLLGMVAVVLMISVFRIHPFISLMLAAVLVGLVSAELPAMGDLPHLARAVELPMQEFGSVAGKIAWVIALAAIIGSAMMESGAAGQIVNWLIRSLGEKRASWALLISGFVLSIPVFFDTVFFLLIPLAIALVQKTGKNYVLYIIAMAGGAVITHCLVAPTPGPLIMAETLKIDLGITILAGLAAGILPAFVVLFMGKRLDRRLQIPLRVAFGHTHVEQTPPSLLLSLLPVVVPIALISLASVTEVLSGKLPVWMAFWGNKNVAMAIGTVLALWLWARQRKLSPAALWAAVSQPLEIAGVIILITSAGGAFGAMIKHSGIGPSIEQAMESFHLPYILVAWLIAAVMKTAQGSSTVAMITSSSIMFAIIGTGADLPYHPVYVFLAVGFGSMFVCWMNDSGFWVVTKMSGFTEKEGLQTWTLTTGVIGLVGLLQLLLFSQLIPMK